VVSTKDRLRFYIVGLGPLSPAKVVPSASAGLVFRLAEYRNASSAINRVVTLMLLPTRAGFC